MSKLLDQVRQANIYLQPAQFSLAIIANIINIRVICSRVLRKSPCTHYFLAYTIVSIIYTCSICSTQFLRGFYIDWANGRIGCKIHFYISFLLPFQANLMLILALFDRYCSSSKSSRIHSRSTVQKTRINIKCLQQTNLLISIYILLPLLMMIFCFMTISNIRQHMNRTRLVTASIRRCRTEGQLTRMLCLQVSVHLILALPFAVLDINEKVVSAAV
ncbi:unnamed protein product [Adineta steineri]|uniref:G-protein coupled receptors family 1 profile domain-containing protein n=1 Tax=Adineta steineri TaxID=433720 RepID=A0A814JQT7_9BILA|nr:unnamed protein product [Adineta steineri]CAF3732503.1 unnamed protein product [Adineta steineri]